MSNQNNQNAINTLTNIVANFTAMISTRMPDDVVDKLKQLREGEDSPMGKSSTTPCLTTCRRRLI